MVIPGRAVYGGCDVLSGAPAGLHQDRAPHRAGAQANTVGKRTLVDQLDATPSMVQRKAIAAAAGHEAVHAAAAHGTADTPEALPYRDMIQRAFGRHDVSQIGVHVGGRAAEGAARMGARAYAAGDQVAFADAPTLHTAAHEAAHVLQQRAGIALEGGVGAEGDVHERHADAIADRVVQGASAEDLFDAATPAAASGTAAVQRKVTVGDGACETATIDGRWSATALSAPGPPKPVHGDHRNRFMAITEAGHGDRRNRFMAIV